MKILEKNVDYHIQQALSIHDYQSSFVQERCTTDAIFVLEQMQEKCLVVNKQICMTFIYLENAFNCVPQIFIWWDLRKLCFPANEQHCTKPCLCCLWLKSKFWKWRLRCIMARCVVLCSSLSCWRHCNLCYALEVHWRISMQIIMSSLLNRGRNVSGGSWYRTKPCWRRGWG